MESCTAGQIASLLTDTSGSSAIIEGAFVTYSNEAKIQIGVSEKIINEYGVYSKETAAEMAMVCREFYDADIGIGVTGTFGNVDPKKQRQCPRRSIFCNIYKRRHGKFLLCGARTTIQIVLQVVYSECNR